MNVVLASTGYPQRELTRLQTLLPQLTAVYESIIFSVPSSLTHDEIRVLESLPHVLIVVNQDWSQGRYSAIQKALDGSAQYIHYADLDRVLHWVETNPVEWQQVVSSIKNADCLIIGRTEKAFKSHPMALQQTENIINIVFSNLLGQPVDLGGGSRGFSRQAVEFIMENSSSNPSWCADSEWVMLLHHAGFHVGYIAVNGLEAPSYPATYDTDVKHWEYRVKIALDVIRAGIEGAKKRMLMSNEKRATD